MKLPFSSYPSATTLSYCPGRAPAKFWLAVQNNSSEFSSFHFNLKAAGESESSPKDWYRLVGADSYAIPPKDCVRFEVEILSLPPNREGFVGVICLQATVSSPKLKTTESQTLRLQVTGVPPQILLQSETIQATPKSQVQIPVELKNLNDQPISLALCISGLPPAWLTEEQRSLILDPNGTRTLMFLCSVPDVAEAPQGLYPFSVEVLQSGNVTATQTAILEVLQAGQVEVSCDTPHLQIPATSGRWLNRHPKPVTYELQWQNQSNNLVQGDISVQEISSSSGWSQQFPGQTKFFKIKPVPDRLNLPLASTCTSQITVEYRPPLLGLGSYKQFKLQDLNLHPPTVVHNKLPDLSLTLLPIIPRWLQGLGVLGLLLTSWLLLSQGHRATVNHVEFPYPTTEVAKENNTQNLRKIVSGGENGTLLAWPLRANLRWLMSQHNPFSPSNRTAIEVVRYSPDNHQVAVGYASGEIKIYDWESRRYLYSLKNSIYETCKSQDQYLVNPNEEPVYGGDRVFDLAFSPDGQFLHSVYGSGRVVQWDLTKDFISSDCLQASQDAAIAAATLVEHKNKQWLAVAGQNHHLRLINLDTPFLKEEILLHENNKKSSQKTIKLVGKDDHITGLDSPKNKPSLLAIGDTQGKITLLDLDTCNGNVSDCVAEQPWVGHNGTPIRSVAFTDDGCYLVSAGDDGKVKLWQLQPPKDDSTSKAIKIPSELVPGEEFVVRTSRQRFSRHPFRLLPLETVDVVRVNGKDRLVKLSDRSFQDKLLIASGGEDQQVRLQTIPVSQLDAHFGEQYQCPAP